VKTNADVFINWHTRAMKHLSIARPLYPSEDFLRRRFCFS